MHTREISVGQNTLRFETGKLAKQAHGSVIVRLGDSVVLVTACHSANPREGIDFLPLTVDYREYTYASGRIPGGFFKREGKPAEKEVLTSRMIDRPTRPLFPAGWRYETQIIALVLSSDQENDTDVLAITGASVALALSDMPVREDDRRGPHGPGRRPVHRQSDLQAAQREQARPDRRRQQGRPGDGRGRRQGSTEEQVVTALDTAHAAIKQIVAVIDDLAKEAGKKKMTVAVKELSAGIEADVEAKVYKPLQAAMRIREKLENYEHRRSGQEGPRRQLSRHRSRDERPTPRPSSGELKEKVLREEVLTHGVRLDGRKFDEIRNIWIETGVLPRVHGSAVFTRGETQALVTCTLGTADDAQKIESFEGETWKTLHAPLQLPAVLGRRNRPHDRPGPPRDRPRRARRARAGVADAGGSRLPLHRPHRLGHPRVATAPRRWRRSAADRWR